MLSKLTGAGSEGQCRPHHGLFSCPISQRQPHVVNLDEARRYRRPPVKADPCAVSMERHGRAHSRTSILSPHRALLGLNPSANRQSIKPLKCALPLTRNEGRNLYTNQDSQTVVRLSPVSGPVAGSSRPPSTRGRETGDTGRLNAYRNSTLSNYRIRTIPGRASPEVYSQGQAYPSPRFKDAHCKNGTVLMI
jgi:hypothetical protein